MQAGHSTCGTLAIADAVITSHHIVAHLIETCHTVAYNIVLQQYTMRYEQFNAGQAQESIL